MTVLFRICQEVFRTSKAQTDRVFMILTVYSSLLPRREHFYPSVTRARSMYDPLAYISDTPRVSYESPPSGGGVSKPWSASRALFLVSGDETRVDAVGWTKNVTRQQRPDFPDGRELTGLAEGSYPYRYTTRARAALAVTPRHAAALKGCADWSPSPSHPWRRWASGHQGRKSVARPESDSDKSPCMPDARAEREGEILWRFSEIDMLSYVCLYHTYTLLWIPKIDDRFKLKIDIRYYIHIYTSKKSITKLFVLWNLT